MSVVLLTFIFCVTGFAFSVFAGQSAGPRFFICGLPVVFVVAIALGQQNRQRLLVCLLGGRIQPAAMTAIVTQPDIIACVVSADEPQTAERLLNLLRERNMACHPASVRTVKASSALQAEQAVAAILNSYPDAEPLISLTGAPMPMGVGACQVARRVGCPAYYLDTARRALVDLMHEDGAATVDLRLSLADFMQVHGLIVRREDAARVDQPLPIIYDNALHLLQQDFALSAGLLVWLAQNVHKDHPWRSICTLSDRSLDLLQQLVDLSLFSAFRLQRSGGNLVVHAAIANPDYRHFLGGGWLECYTYSIARSLQQAGAPLFDCTAYGLHMRSGESEREVDFVGLRGSVPLIASCKTSAKEAWKKGVIDEVATVGKNIGDNYCTKLYITNRITPQAGEPSYRALVQLRQQARNAKVVIVAGEALPDLGDILLREATHPTYTRL